MRYRLICWMLLGWFVAGYGYAQIRGGAETARFEPGDRILYQEDLSGTPIGELMAVTGEMKSGEKTVARPDATLVNGTLVKVAK